MKRIGMASAMLGLAGAALAFQSIATKLTLENKVVGKLVTYYRPLRIQLQATAPRPLTKEPKYVGKVQYGAIMLGDAPGYKIVIAVDEPAEGDRLLYVDRNGNGDLTDDGPGAWDVKRASGQESVFQKDAVVTARYAGGQSAEYGLTFYRFSQRLQELVLYYRNAARTGTVKLGEAEYKVALIDENGDGKFDDLANTTLLLDLDRDGKLTGRPDSHESYKAGEPFHLNGSNYEIQRVSAAGDDLVIVKSERTAEPKVIVAAGFPAPTFTTKDLEGRPLDFPKTLQGKVVFLDFWATW